MQLLFDTLIRSSELALVAVGLSAVFAVSKFANVAHVEFATMGALFTLLVTEWLGVGILMAAVFAAIATGLVGVVLQRTVFQRLLRSGPAIAMIGSLALAIFLRAAFQTAFGARPRAFDRPLERGISVAGALITPTQVWAVVVGVVVLALFLLLLHRTKLGRTLRAVAANPQLAQSSGINAARSVDIVWFLSAAVAAVGGIAIALVTQIGVYIGFNILLPVFAVAILGGIGSPAGAVVAAALLAFVERLVVTIDFGSLFGTTPMYLPISYAAAVGFLVLVVTLLTRPQGLFGGGARDA
jgi:branched-subunit amino acid ABC-type transport system permease component